MRYHAVRPECIFWFRFAITQAYTLMPLAGTKADLNHKNRVLKTEEFLPELIIFANDGASEFFAYDKRTESMRIVQIAGSNIEDALLCGYRFAEFLEYLKKGEFGPRISEGD